MRAFGRLTSGPSGPFALGGVAAMVGKACFRNDRRGADQRLRHGWNRSRGRGLGPGPPGDAGRHRRRQCGDRRPGRGAMGLSAAAAAACAHSDALSGAGADGPARHPHRPGPCRIDPRTLRARMGARRRRGPRRRGDRLARHRVHRRRRDRRDVRPLAQLHPAAGDGRAPRHRRDRLLSAGRAGRDSGRPVRTRVFRRRLGGASEFRDKWRATR